MTFEEYLASAPGENRQEILNLLANYGEPGAVLAELAAIVPFLQNQAVDLRVNEKYFFLHQNKAFMVPAHTTLFRMNHIKYCYFSYRLDCGTIGLVGQNGAHLEYSFSAEVALRLFHKLRTYIKGFENVKPCTPQEKAAERILPAGIYCSGKYVLRNNTISLAHTSLFGRKKERLEVRDINDIIWCQQFTEADCDVDSEIVNLYLLGQREPVQLVVNSTIAGFQLVLELKKRIPHLLYGYNKEYEEIYKRDPAALLAIARARMRY